MKSKKRFSSLPHSFKFFSSLPQSEAPTGPPPQSSSSGPPRLRTKTEAVKQLANIKVENNAYIIRAVDEATENGALFAATVVTSKRPKGVDCIKNKNKTYMWHLTSTDPSIRSKKEFERYINEVLESHDKAQLKRVKSDEGIPPNKCAVS